MNTLPGANEYSGMREMRTEVSDSYFRGKQIFNINYVIKSVFSS